MVPCSSDALVALLIVAAIWCLQTARHDRHGRLPPDGRYGRIPAVPLALLRLEGSLKCVGSAVAVALPLLAFGMHVKNTGLRVAALYLAF